MEIRVKVNSTYNNTIITALHKDRILKTISTGSIGFKKAKRASTLAAQAAGESLGYWLLLLDKALSQKIILTKSKVDTSVMNSSLTQKKTSVKGDQSKTKGELTQGLGVTDSKISSIEKDLSHSRKEARGETHLSKESLENLQIKELSNPKLKIPNAKLVATGGSLTHPSDSRGNKKDSLDSSVKTKFSKPHSKKNTGSLNFIKPLSVMVSGVGHGKFGAIKGLAKMGIKIKRISDVTAVPHNGCKPPKMRRK